MLLLRLDTTNRYLLESDTSLNTAQPPVAGERETPRLRLELYETATDATAPTRLTALPSPFTSIRIVVKRPTELAYTRALAILEPADFTQVGSGSTTAWEAILDLDTEEIRDLFIDGSPVQNSTFDIQFRNTANTLRDTYLRQQQLILVKAVATGNEGIPRTGTPAYPPALGIIEYRPELATFTGGTADALDSLPTATGALPVGKLLQFIAPGPLLRTYRLDTGTTATSLPDYVRAADYAPTTNEKIWTHIPHA